MGNPGKRLDNKITKLVAWMQCQKCSCKTWRSLCSCGRWKFNKRRTRMAIFFSVGEKLLIYSFEHTQLLYYALIKTLLKYVIVQDFPCKDWLCSYYIKTILFRISEELPASIWKPKHLITCFMRCFKRLIYCVEYSVCPHYFIPDNNLFEQKMKGNAKEILLNKLYILSSFGWECSRFSDLINKFEKLEQQIHKKASYLHKDSLTHFLI